MKIRQGFVSNSSSSSFILIGSPVALHRLKPEHIKKKQYYAVGMYMSEGYDGFMIEHADMLQAMKNVDYDFEVFEYVRDGEDALEIDISMFEGREDLKLVAKGFEIDYHSSRDAQDIYDNYNDKDRWY